MCMLRKPVNGGAFFLDLRCLSNLLSQFVSLGPLVTWNALDSSTFLNLLTVLSFWLGFIIVLRCGFIPIEQPLWLGGSPGSRKRRRLAPFPDLNLSNLLSHIASFRLLVIWNALDSSTFLNLLTVLKVRLDLIGLRGKIIPIPGKPDVFASSEFRWR